jgi:hypothetical protein
VGKRGGIVDVWDGLRGFVSGFEGFVGYIVLKIR